MAIRLGVGAPINPPVEGVIRAAQRSEAKGYDSLWWPDHLMGWHSEAIWTTDIVGPIAAAYPNPHIYLDPVACIAACGPATQTIRLGTAVTEPIRRNPAMLANEWLTLDHFTKGRAILGIGAGEAENIVPYGLDYSKPAGKFEEALEIIRLLWGHPGEPVDFDGDHWTLRRAVCGLAPYGDRPPPIWTGAHGPRMLDVTGRLADGWLPVFLPPDEWRARFDRIRAAASKYRRDPDAIEGGVFLNLVITSDHEEAHRILDRPIPKGFLLAASSAEFEALGHTHPFGKGFYGLKEYIPTRYSREDALAAIEGIPFEVAHELITHGTPDDVVGLLKEFESVGCSLAVALNITYLGDATKVGESYHLIDDVVRALG